MRTKDDTYRNKQRERSVETDLQTPRLPRRQHSQRRKSKGALRVKARRRSDVTTPGQTHGGTVGAVRQKRINQTHASWKGKYRAAITFVENSGESKIFRKNALQFSSVAQSCPTLCDPMNRSTPGLPGHHHLPEFTQTHVHQVSDAIQPSHPLSSPSPPAPNPSQHQSLFQ